MKSLTNIRVHIRDSMPKNLVEGLVMKSRGWPVPQPK